MKPTVIKTEGTVVFAAYGPSTTNVIVEFPRWGHHMTLPPIPGDAGLKRGDKLEVTVRKAS